MLEIGIIVALGVVAYCVYYTQKPAPKLNDAFEAQYQSKFSTPLDPAKVVERLSQTAAGKDKLVERSGHALMFEQGPKPTMLGAFIKVDVGAGASGGSTVSVSARSRAHETTGAVRRAQEEFIGRIEPVLA